MPESFQFLGFLDLARQAQVPALLTGRELRHTWNRLATPVADPLAIFFHNRMVSRTSKQVEVQSPQGP